MVVGSVALGDQTGAVELVEAGLLEADREGLQGALRVGRGERRDPARVDPAGEQHADRDVGDQVGADRVGEDLAQLGGEQVGGALALLDSPAAAGPSVAAHGQLAVLPAQQMARAQLARLAEDRQRRRDRVEGEVGGERLGVDLPREAGLLEHRLQLRGERQLTVDEAVVERLDPEAVAGEQEAFAAVVPERDREHPPQPLDEGVSPCCS